MSAVWGLDLPDSEMLILLALADWSNDDGECWPSIAQLVKKTRKSERTIQGAIKSMAVAGHLTREERLGKGCTYRLHPRSDCAPADSAPRKGRTPAKSAPPQPLPPTPAAAADNTSIHITSSVQATPSQKSAGEPALRPEHVVEAWNDTAGRLGLAKARLTPERRKKLTSRLRQHPIEDWTEAIAAIERSPFLRGENDKAWRANFDFLLQPTSFTKLIEGTYDRPAH